MSDRHVRRLWLSALILVAAAPDVPRRAQPAAYLIRWSPGSDSTRASIEVSGIDQANLDALARSGWDHARWSQLFSVTIASSTSTAGERPSILGKYHVTGRLLRFEPKFPIEPGLLHSACFRPAKLPLAADGSQGATLEFTKPLPPPSAPAIVDRVDPSADRLPENLLKFYVHFSRPMARGEAYSHVRLIAASGKPVERPFLELGEELWDPTGKRLTLLLDPGRIKRGLRPREEEGPILKAGETYSLVVDRAWPDAQGQPLRQTFRKSFHAIAADETQPAPKLWDVRAPAPGTRDAVSIRFPEPLDRAMLERVLAVRDSAHRLVPGRVVIDEGETRWRFIPDRPWIEGTFEILVETSLEDLAGNSIARPFEVDILRPIERGIEAQTVAIPLSIGKRDSR